MSETITPIPHKMYVWRKQYEYLVVVHAKTVAEDRALAIEESNGDGDDSTPVRVRAIQAVLETNPEIHYRRNAEFVLLINGELEEMNLYCATQDAKIQELEKALRAERNETA